MSRDTAIAIMNGDKYTHGRNGVGATVTNKTDTPKGCVRLVLDGPGAVAATTITLEVLHRSWRKQPPVHAAEKEGTHITVISDRKKADDPVATRGRWREALPTVGFIMLDEIEARHE